MKNKKRAVLDSIPPALTIIFGVIIAVCLPAAKEAYLHDFRPQAFFLLRCAVYPMLLFCLGYSAAWLPTIFSDGAFRVRRTPRVILFVLAMGTVAAYALVILSMFFTFFQFVPVAVRAALVDHMEYLFIPGVLTFFCTRRENVAGLPEVTK